MTMNERLAQVALDAKIETVHDLLKRKYADALQAQLDRFEALLSEAQTAAEKTEVASDWLEWLVS